MSTKAQVKTQAQTPAAPAAARISKPPVAEPEHEAERPDIATQLEGAARLGHRLGAVSVDSSAPPIIQRQEVPEEEELQMKREPAALQRQEIPEEEEEELQMKREPAALQRQEQPKEEEELMLKPDIQRVGAEGGPVSPEVESAINRARGGGQPLEGAVQVQMSEALGHDFSGVRVHTDAEADELNQQLQAKAFTAGPDIFFRRGEYKPGSSGGRELIAHELSHVVQQSSRRVSRDGSGRIVRPAGEAFEQEADRAAEAATRSTANSVQEQTTQAQDEETDLLALQRAVANPGLASPADIFALQRRYGNRAVHGLLKRRQGAREELITDEQCPHEQQSSGRVPGRGGGSIDKDVAGGGQIQRAVVTTMSEHEWLSELNKPLAERLAEDPHYKWGEYEGAQGRKVAVMGHGLPGCIYDTREEPNKRYSGEEVANELARGWKGNESKLKEVILWSCYAGEKESVQGGPNPSLVSATRDQLADKGIRAKVSGAVGVHIPDVPHEVRYVGPKFTEEAKRKQFKWIEGHYRRMYWLATDQDKQAKTIPSGERPGSMRGRGDKNLMVGGTNLHTWQEVWTEMEARNIYPDKTLAMKKIKRFYTALFSDPDFKELVKEVAEPASMEVKWPRVQRPHLVR